MTALTFIFLSLSQIKYHKSPTPSNDQSCCSFEKFCIFLFELTFTYEWLITIFYWSFLYDPLNPIIPPLHIDICQHIVPLACLIVEYCLNKIPFIMSHLVFVILFGLVYGGYNCAWTIISGSPVYSIITWKDRGTAIFFCVVVGLVTIIFLVLHQIARAKNRSDGQVKHKTLNEEVDV